MLAYLKDDEVALSRSYAEHIRRTVEAVTPECRAFLHAARQQLRGHTTSGVASSGVHQSREVGGAYFEIVKGRGLSARLGAVKGGSGRRLLSR